MDHMDTYGHIRTYTDIYGNIRRYTDMYGHVRTCTDIYEHIWTYMSTYQPLAAGCHCLRQASATSEKTRPCCFLSMYIVNLVNFHEFEVLLDDFSKSGQSGQMTMPTRRASEFCAKRRAVSPEVFSQSLIS